jgi:hypothetical protein
MDGAFFSFFIVGRKRGRPRGWEGETAEERARAEGERDLLIAILRHIFCKNKMWLKKINHTAQNMCCK